MKLYTGRGDSGKTNLFGTQKKVSKSSLRVSAYGDVDELNSFIGLIRTEDQYKETQDILDEIQRDLFKVGADLATSLDSPSRRTASEEIEAKIPTIGIDSIKKLEMYIDRATKELSPMAHFILPGGSKIASHFHVARTICRRTERSVVALMETDRINPNIVIYLNRLSDLMFALARLSNKRVGVSDIEWMQ